MSRSSAYTTGISAVAVAVIVVSIAIPLALGTYLAVSGYLGDVLGSTVGRAGVSGTVVEKAYFNGTHILVYLSSIDRQYIKRVYVEVPGSGIYLVNLDPEVVVEPGEVVKLVIDASRMVIFPGDHVKISVVDRSLKTIAVASFISSERSRYIELIQVVSRYFLVPPKSMCSAQGYNISCYIETSLLLYGYRAITEFTSPRYSISPLLSVSIDTKQPLKKSYSIDGMLRFGGYREISEYEVVYSINGFMAINVFGYINSTLVYFYSG